MSVLKLRGEAPGKVILLGEHAVVYGAPAIGFPLKRRMAVELVPGAGLISLSSNEDVEIPAPRDAASPREIIERALGPVFDSHDVHVHYGFPPMSGFGSSAALALALVRARAQHEKTDLEPDEVFKRLLAVERIAHAKPSGVDPAICMADGLLHFRRPSARGKPLTRRIAPAKALNLLVGTVGAHGGARGSISRVAELKERSSALVRATMQALGEAASTGERALKKGELEVLGSAMNLAHGILSGLELVSSEVDAVVQKARHVGALGAKMSGAGGEGGAFVALFPSKKTAEAAEAELRLASVHCWLERVAA
ncbi:MAG: mevalonate kinase [Myxococcota bacterium]